MKREIMKLLSPAFFGLATFVMLGLNQAQAQTNLVRYIFTDSSPYIYDEVTTGAENAQWSVGGAAFGGGDRVAYSRNSNLTTSFDSNDYLELTISANAGYELDLSSFTFELGGSNSTANTATSYAEVRTNVDDYGASLLMTPGDVTAASALNDGAYSGATYTISLSGAEYQDLSSITLRIYAYYDGESTAFWKADTATFIGTTSVIPEPGSFALLAGILGLAFVALRRRS